MLRLRILPPLLLLASLATPAIGDFHTSHCTAAPGSPRCEAEIAREFERARNAEIEASIAAVNVLRARIAELKTHCKTPNSNEPRCVAERMRQHALLLTHCKTPDSTTPRCLKERAQEFARLRGLEMARSMAAAKAERERQFALRLTHCKSPNSMTPRCMAERERKIALALTHCKTPDSTSPRCLEERAREFAKARNAEIDRSIAAVKAERARQFAAARNAEIEQSIAAVEARRSRTLALAVTHCKTPDSKTPRCLKERALEFAKARNAEIERSIAAVKAERERAFAAARNSEINASLAAVAFRRARNAEIERSVAAVNAERKRVIAMRGAPITVGSTCQRYNWLTAPCDGGNTGTFLAGRNPDSERSTAAARAERARAVAAHKSAITLASGCQPHNWLTASCQTESNGTFLAGRKVEDKRSMAAVEANRQRAVATHEAAITTASACQPHNWLTAACETKGNGSSLAVRNPETERVLAFIEAERARAFEAAHNAEIEASIAAVKAARARAVATHKATMSVASACQPHNWLTAACEGDSKGALMAAHNAEIERLIASAKDARLHAFEVARNAEIDASIAAVKARRALRVAMESRKGPRVVASSGRHVETGAIGAASLSSADPRVKARSSKQHARHVKPCRVAGRLTDPLQFTGNSTEIDAQMKSTLSQIALIAKDCPAVRMEIHGYSDTSGPSQVNRRLAQRRAQAARDYLVSLGVDSKRVAAIGRGESEPLAPNTTAQNRARNRRIEIQIVDPAMQAAARRIMWDLAELLDPTFVPPLAHLSP